MISDIEKLVGAQFCEIQTTLLLWPFANHCSFQKRKVKLSIIRLSAFDFKPAKNESVGGISMFRKWFTDERVTVVGTSFKFVNEVAGVTTYEAPSVVKGLHFAKSLSRKFWSKNTDLLVESAKKHLHGVLQRDYRIERDTPRYDFQTCVTA